MKKSERIVSEVSAAASVMARLSRVNPTKKQIAASRANGVNGGRPSCVKLLSDLMAVATGQISHDFQGGCPDSDDPGGRNAECAACRVLCRADLFLNTP